MQRPCGGGRLGVDEEGEDAEQTTPALGCDNKLWSRMNDCTRRLHCPVSHRSGHAWFSYSVRAACMALSVGGEVIRKELSLRPCLRLMCLWLFYFPSLLTS